MEHQAETHGAAQQRAQLIEKFEKAVGSISKAIHYAYRGSAEHGSFLVGTRTEYVPSVFMTLHELEDALAELKKL